MSAIATARAFCSEHGIDEKHVLAVANLIVNVKEATQKACGEKALIAIDRAFEAGMNAWRPEP